MHHEDRLLRLSEAQWARIEAAFPQRRGRSGFERKISHRLVFEAVLLRARTGCPWRDLPAACGDGHTIYRRWQRWVEGGVPPRALAARYLAQAKAGALDPGLACLDSTSVRAHPHAAGAPGKRGIKPWAARAGA